MAGAIIIVIVLLALPVIVLMSGGVVSAILGQMLTRDGNRRHAGNELVTLDD